MCLVLLICSPSVFMHSAVSRLQKSCVWSVALCNGLTIEALMILFSLVMSSSECEKLFRHHLLVLFNFSQLDKRWTTNGM